MANDQSGVMHWLAHLFGWNTGTVYTWWDSDTDRLMVGFQCDGCDTISGVHGSRIQRRRDGSL